MTGSADGSLPNPYVGPRPFEPGERLYGRDREISELDHFLAAERIVLLHSPSGAGKSSLLQAGMMPRLRECYDVWGPVRVGLEPPPALAGRVNRYALSALAGFEEGVPERLRRPLETLAGQTLHDYVDGRPHRRSAPHNLLLIFDQFEEVLTVEPLAVAAKRELFDQLGELLRNPRVSALLALREDYLAALDPYARQVPSHLHNRFRIDLLGLDGARAAIVEPALAAGREFPAADRLVHDLATMQVQQPDGSFRAQRGHHVEPVQLQVVCFRLWHAMPAGKRSIEAGDLERFGDVTEALGGYYADSVSRLAAGDDARERAIREWFGEALITTEGIRGQVLRGAGESEGLDNELIARLLDSHLVRAEQRAGATWYELAHDRLIAPVRADNAAWGAEYLSEFQQRAALWQRQGRPPSLLLQDQELAAAERWAAGSSVTTEVELRYLAESREAQAVADRERRQARRIKVLGIAATIIGTLALIASVFAVWQWRQAVTQQQRANREAETAHQVSEFMVDLFEVSDPGEARGNTITAREILDRGAEKIQRGLDDQPLTRARLMDTIGRVYFKLGLLEPAEPLFQGALDMRERLDGEGLELATSLHNLGRLRWLEGRLEEAEPLLRRALEIRERNLGPDHPEVAASLRVLADVLSYRGLLEEAEPLYIRTVAIQEQVLGPDHPDLAWGLLGLGSLLRDQDRSAEAEPLLERALEMMEGTLGPDHWGLYAPLANLGLMYVEQGRYQEAEPLAVQMLALTEKVLGPDHWITGASLQQLAGIHVAQGRYPQAEPLVRRALVIADDAPVDYFEWLVWLAGHYLARGRDVEAEPLFRRALAKFEELGPEEPTVAWVLRGLARVYQSRGATAEAEDLYRRALAVLESHPDFQGSDMIPGEAAAPELDKTLRDYAALLRALGRDGEASDLERRAPTHS